MTLICHRALRLTLSGKTLSKGNLWSLDLPARQLSTSNALLKEVFKRDKPHLNIGKDFLVKSQKEVNHCDLTS